MDRGAVPAASGTAIMRRRILGSRGGNSALLFGGLALAALATAALVGLWYTPYAPDAFAVHLRLAARPRRLDEIFLQQPQRDGA